LWLGRICAIKRIRIQSLGRIAGLHFPVPLNSGQDKRQDLKIVTWKG
jgi:hypothetical protein